VVSSHNYPNDKENRLKKLEKNYYIVKPFDSVLMFHNTG